LAALVDRASSTYALRVWNIDTMTSSNAQGASLKTMEQSNGTVAALAEGLKDLIEHQQRFLQLLQSSINVERTANQVSGSGLASEPEGDPEEDPEEALWRVKEFQEALKQTPVMFKASFRLFCKGFDTQRSWGGENPKIVMQGKEFEWGTISRANFDTIKRKVWPKWPKESPKDLICVTSSFSYTDAGYLAYTSQWSPTNVTFGYQMSASQTPPPQFICSMLNFIYSSLGLKSWRLSWNEISSVLLYLRVPSHSGPTELTDETERMLTGFVKTFAGPWSKVGGLQRCSWDGPVIAQHHFRYLSFSDEEVAITCPEGVRLDWLLRPIGLQSQGNGKSLLFMMEKRFSVAVHADVSSLTPVFVLVSLWYKSIWCRYSPDEFKEKGFSPGGIMKGFVAFQFKLYELVEMWFEAWIESLTRIEIMFQVQVGISGRTRS
jgi:hypothetical protein